MIPAYDEAAVTRMLDDRVRQGFPLRCSDPAILTEIANVIRAVDAVAGTKKSARFDTTRTLKEVSASDRHPSG